MQSIFTKNYSFALVVLFSFFSNFSFAQNEELDRLFKYHKYDSLQILLFETEKYKGNIAAIARADYFNRHKQLQKSFETLFEIDTTKLDDRLKAYYFHYLGDAFDINSNAEQASRNFKKAQNYYKKIGDMLRYNSINHDLFYTVGNPDIYAEDTDYLAEFFTLAKDIGDPNQLANAEIEMAFESLNKESSSSFLDHIQNAYNYQEQDPNPFTLGVIHTFHGMYYTDIETDKDSAAHYYNKAIKINQALDLPHKVALGYYNLSDLARYTKDYETAIFWAKKANENRNLNYDFDLTAYIYKNLSEDYKSISEIDSAYKYLNLSLQYRDSLNLQKQNISLTRFQAEKKDKENLLLKQENDRKQNLIYATIGALFFIIILSISLYQNSKKKRALAEKDKVISIKKIEKSLKEQELKAIDAIIEGQEKERARIASDLHDNIGANFTAINSFFEHIKSKFSEKEEVATLFDKTHQLLEETYHEIRGLAHLKHSGVLAKNGLEPALKTLAKNISDFSKVEVELNMHIQEKLSNNIELNVFRIIQELMTNIIKHAKATEASISLTSLENNQLSVIIEDNGVGFDENNSNHQDSIGLKNVSQRIEYLNGKIQIDSKIGRGTTILIDIPLS
ncbi:sensor histidine kinase [Psychroflexus aestuariivivens]|uniref:sensor histidine kinase n=1 Tax=Psychroflexus aestuariivivens TaxID=1795040 RepID=UPI000FDBA824|nr:sensor histidine kinase [Psychroflexus aestuariivivens]